MLNRYENIDKLVKFAFKQVIHAGFVMGRGIWNVWLFHKRHCAFPSQNEVHGCNSPVFERNKIRTELVLALFYCFGELHCFQIARRKQRDLIILGFFK